MIDWDRIVQDAGPSVWRTTRRLLGNFDDAQEVWQETFASALELSKRTSQPVRNWQAMLVTLATARATDRLRQRIRRTSHERSNDTAVDRLPDKRTSTRPIERAEEAEMSHRLREALTHLPPKQADAFCLHCLEGWSYRELAEHLDETVDHVGVLIHRARAALMERIASIISQAPPGGRSRDSSRNASDVDEVSHER
jgi:RNA polymerase sigma-70 factor (ECF subfamily)